MRKEFDAEALGARIRRKRLERGLMQKEFADRLGLSVSFYGHIERGTRIPSLPTLVLIANELNVGSDTLLQDSLEAPYLPPRANGWTDRQLGVFREFLQQRDEAWTDWFDEASPQQNDELR